MGARLLLELDRRGPSSKRRELTNTSHSGNSSSSLRSSLSTRNSQALKLVEERCVFLASQRASSCRGTLERVDLAGPAERGAALLVRVGIWKSEELASVASNNVLDIVEDIAFKDTLSTSVTTL
mgnify:CR=1 FL=1